MHTPTTSSILRSPAARRGSAWLLGALLVGSGGPLLAQPAWAPQGGFVQAGAGEDVGALTAGLTWPWERRWRVAGGELGGYWEASLSRWRIGHDTAPRSGLNQFALTPVFRWRPGGGASDWFAEGAIGLTYSSSRYDTGEKRFSTHFNFGDHVALGRSFGADRRHELLLRVQHFSNAGVRRPNPGENFVQLRYAARFD
ncbi:acyloxyacyl hydrolase [Caldimonas tepidiphila]|uniref:acyloxyacyl hydrolase n=1 Tax=Caldimonas tepidiphila TaxID=2315841 RepID=UPI000E5AED0F|nr:acyloxyacyl hydrolase [Caldimonas tepidiphila]